MLSKLVVSLYSVLLEVALWLILLGGFITGWQSGGFFGAIGGLIGAAIFGAVIFGAFLVLNDIRQKVDSIASKKQ
ncbi:hypothetical protein [Thiomicrorhabdus cannonii]|uniref:hypothetical protein n=1 Tax=Thiomicrorhabdus cannonii TaxID=2748011 RepID=UPI0015BB7E7E|nr:hypothetical protein [Thiomicrorhabdus cannonii]